MRTAAATLILLVCSLLTGVSSGQEKPAIADALAFQDALQDVIARTEGAIGCVIVSRSDDYRRWNGAPPSPETGQLGRFNTRELWGPLIGRPNQQPQERLDLLAHDLANPNHTPESFGTGIVIDGEAGLVLTNGHVVRNATKIYVRLPRGGSYADIHALDPRSDLAVLRLLDVPANLKAIPFGDGGKARKGQLVLLLANPFAAGFRDGSPSASLGMVANLRRRAPGLRGELDRTDRERQTLHHFGTLMQIDARMNLGSSGGAVVDLKGELIGLTSALAALTGVETPGGFAVPMDAGMRRIIDVLRRGEEVEYGFLGVHLDTTQVGPQEGVTIGGVADGSPASRAGLMAKDRITSIDGVPVHENDDLLLQIGTHLAGSSVRMTVQGRGGPPRSVVVKLAKYYTPGPMIAANRPPVRFGLRVDYTSILSQRVVMPLWSRAVPEGVVIREVVPNSAADRARLQTDKVITRVNGQPVSSPAEYYQLVDKAGQAIVLTLLDSDGREEKVTLEKR